MAGTPRSLDELMAGLGIWPDGGRDGDGLEVTGLTDRSDEVVPGGLFVGRPGAVGRFNPDHLAEAVRRGASTVLLDQRIGWPAGLDRSGLVVLRAERVDQAVCGGLAERFYGWPSRRLRILAVTGTNGKTTVAWLMRYLLRRAGVKCGLLSTIEIDTGAAGGVVPAELTTPGAIELSRSLAAMVSQGCGSAAMEASSHALDQRRLDAIAGGITSAVFTNLSGDHLDYHGTMDAYADAKARLFEMLGPEATAVLNLDDPLWQRMGRDCRARVIGATVRGSDGADLVGRTLGGDGGVCGGGTEALLAGPWGQSRCRMPLIGPHNVLNALQAAAACFAVSAFSADELAGWLAEVPAVPGRLEWVRIGSTADAGAQDRADDEAGGEHTEPIVLVDYSHTDDALRNALEVIRPLAKTRGGRVWTVFGCGGDRDRTKRPRMAARACANSEAVIITSDNPRSEDPLAIIEEARAGVPSGWAGELVIEPDRASAIHAAVTRAGPRDFVLIAGKGHEDYQIIGDRKLHFDDREQAREALRLRREGSGSA